MRGVIYDRFAAPPRVATLPDPEPPPHGAVIEVRATGVCRSDWHGWLGHDPDISVPHVPGHEFAGVVRSVGPDVRRWRGGERVTAPFVCACGACPECLAGEQQVCREQTQPGFTHWGSFAELVVVHHADVNLVGLPQGLEDATAASLGCRFATAFRAVVDVGSVQAGEWVAVHGCGGVGLSAVMIAAAAGAQVVAVDVSEGALALARSAGAMVTLDARSAADVGAAVVEATDGGAHVSLDALGHRDTATSSILSLRRRGRHVQVGLLVGEEARPALPMERVIAHELQVLGSHGMAAHRYPAMLQLIATGRLAPERLIGRTIALEEATDALTGMDRPGPPGVTVITRF